MIASASCYAVRWRGRLHYEVIVAKKTSIRHYRSIFKGRDCVGIDTG